MQKYFMIIGLPVMLAILTQQRLSSQKADPQDGRDAPVCRPFGKRIVGQLYLPPRLNAQGTPFLSDRWMEGKVIFRDQDTALLSAVNYNAYLDELVYLNPVLNKYIIIDHRSIKGFMLLAGPERPALEFRCPALHQKIRTKFMEALVVDTISLYAVRRVEFVEDPGYPPSAHPDYYHPYNIYYVERPDSSLIRIKPARGQLGKLFPDSKKLINQFIRQGQLKLAEEPDLIKVIRFINEGLSDHPPDIPCP